MDDQLHCQRCNTELTGQVVNGLCANCMLRLALEPLPERTVVLDDSQPGAGEPVKVRYFGDYELLEEIARGGMGVVYKARQVSLNRTVALKMILAGDFSSSAMVERFQTEAEAAARLEHPNIVPIYEIGTHEGQHYFSMRFVEGGTLTDAMAREKFSPHGAAELMVKVAWAVHHAHQRGILHRDLKPGNILFDQAGEPHVADFGLAKVLEHDSSLTQSAAVMGTPSYMAPEQAAGLAKQATTAVDIYSLGAIFYHLLTGRAPFVGSTALETLMRARDQEPLSPQSRNPRVDRDLSVICLKCLEKSPQRRYGSAEALAEELERWLSHEPIRARRVTPVERVQKWARRKPVVAGLVVALHLVGIAGIIGILWQSNRANMEALNARREAKRAESELWNANFTEARALRIAGGSGARVQSSALVQKLVQRPGLTKEQMLNVREEAIAQLALVDLVMPTNWIVNPSDRNLAWNSSLDQYVWSAGSNRVEVREFPLERTVASFSGPTKAIVDRAVFSLDNQFLAVRFSNARGEVRVWRLSTQELVLQTTSTELIHISPDGATLATSQPGGFAVQSLSSDSRARLLRPGRSATKAEFSPDSKRIAVLPANTRDTVEIWDATTGVTLCSFTNDFNPHLIAWHPDGARLGVGGDRGKLEMRTFAMRGVGDQCASPPVSLDGHLGTIRHIQFAPDGSTLLSYGLDQSSIVWDLISRRPNLREQRMAFLLLNAAGDRVVGRRVRPKSESVASLIHRTGFRTVAWGGEARPAFGISISPDARLGVVSYFAIAGQSQGECLLWDFSSGREIARLKGICAQFSADSRTLFAFESYTNKQVRSYDVGQETLMNAPTGWSAGRLVYRGRPGEDVNTGGLSPDGRTLVIAATEAVIFVDTLGQQPTRALAKPAHVVELSNDGRWMLTARQNNPTTLRTANNAEAVMRFEPNGLGRFSPDNRWLAAVSFEGLRLYSLSTLAALQERNDLKSLRPAYDPILLETGAATSSAPLTFSPDSQTFAVVYNRTRVRLYETSTGRELATLSPPNPAQIMGGRALAFSPDGQWLLAAKEDGESVAWNLPVIRAELAKLGLDWEVRQK